MGVALGAFGAHALRRVATPEQLAWWTTATQYLLIHALAVVAVGLVQLHRPAAGAAGWALMAGSAVFSGTLYAMALGAPRWLGRRDPCRRPGDARRLAAARLARIRPRRALSALTSPVQSLDHDLEEP